MDSFGERLKVLRKGKGLSQDDLAEKVGVKSGKQTIWNWENSKSEPTVSDIRKIAAVLDTTLSYLLEGIDPNTSAVSEPKPGYITVPMEEYIDLQRLAIKQLNQEKGEKKEE